ncbi:MAG: ATP-binding cassette domain-containing protein [Bacillota bacterium]
MSLLTINNITKTYGDFKALNNISLSVKPNEVYGFIGRNGAGKTTTINIILSLITKDNGTIFFNDKEIDVTDIHYKKDIGFVPDVPSFPPYMNAQEYLSFSYDSYGLPTRDKNVIIADTLRVVGLEGVTKKTSSYSRGMKQRLAIAGALLHSPKLLIMDEPTSALDPIGRKDVLDIISRLKKDMAIFYSTHILEDAQKVCDRIGLIEQGKMILEDDMNHLIASFDTYNYYIETTNHDTLEKILLETSYISILNKQGNGYNIQFNDKKDITKLLLVVSQSNHHIKVFTEERKQLEDVFIEVLDENHN